jgi:hypothetical protein
LISLGIGIPAYGGQFADWWTNFGATCASLSDMDIRLDSVYSAGTMAVDTNRNIITDAFLKSKAEWLFWWDADNKVPPRGIRRLLDADKTLISGIYVMKDEEKPIPVGYVQDPNTSMYTSIHEFNVGEILPVHAAGLGCCLVHRSVYEDIQKNCEVTQRWNGGCFPVLKSQLKDKLPDDFVVKHDYVVSGGFARIPIRKAPEYKYFPYYVLDGGRTEDYGFFELARAVGHPLWIDTSVQSSHLGIKDYTLKDHQNRLLKIEDTEHGYLVSEEQI